MATNRFACEICNKGFQRDQNLQLHRRGHNLPWKLKQRSSKEVRKKVYVCPEATCVHHDPSRALGDLTGIKKHFSRKHGEKKWKCDKCCKKYAVQSDWKAHSKICGTREYRCDCGTLFSRAFCDALAEESARAVAANPFGSHLFSQPTAPCETSTIQVQPTILRSQFPHMMRANEANTGIVSGGHGMQGELSPEREHQLRQFDMRSNIPPWLACQGPITTSLNHLDLPPSSSSVYSVMLQQEYSRENPPVHRPPIPPAFQASASSLHMSATALLQKASEMGATMSRPKHLRLMAAHASSSAVPPNTTASFALGLSSHQEMGNGTGGGDASGGRGGGVIGGFGQESPPPPPPPLLLHYMVTPSLSSPPGFDGPFEDAFGGMLESKGEASTNSMGGFARSHGMAEEGGGGSGRNDGMTRDFLGLKPFPQRDILDLTGFDPCLGSSSYEQHRQSKKPRHGQLLPEM
ncbi:hypothetical protein B296_00033210 [Ensete ventricosum]|uniref:C2H2-type domain-containing protein n=1 Tax=Ensete ventricosum TaxID=4639 RepID=A0A426XDJ1_ENSVE|nr:hypothetical protein B296_00033210 [Ensete ventricosum]